MAISMLSNESRPWSARTLSLFSPTYNKEDTLLEGGSVVILNSLDNVGFDILSLLEDKMVAGGQLSVLVVSQSCSTAGAGSALGDFLGEVEFGHALSQISQHLYGLFVYKL